MKSIIVEATNGGNWGKFMISQFEGFEWSRRSQIDHNALIRSRGWTPRHIMVFDLQTGEGAMFLPGGIASADLNKHRIWVCPLFEPFLEWLYTQPNPMDIPALIELPDAEFALYGHRRPGPQET